MTSPQTPDDPDSRLTRLLALKRYEVPPPGFFDQLPGRILVNLRAGNEVADAPWWLRTWRSLVREPVAGLSYAALTVGALIFGVSVLETATDVQTPLISPSQGFLMTPSPDFVLSAPNPQGSGVIYRVTDSLPTVALDQPTASLSPTGTWILVQPVSRGPVVEFVPVAYGNPR